MPQNVYSAATGTKSPVRDALALAMGPRAGWDVPPDLPQDK